MDATLLIPNAIVFVFDLENKSVQVPAYTDGVLTAWNNSCVSVGTQSEVDGEVTVKLSGKLSGSERDLYEVAFSGVIETPSKKIAVVTSELEKILEMDVRTEKTEVIISVDDLSFPSVVLVEVS